MSNLDVKKEHSERNYGIDLLRMLMMFFIVIGHILGVGGVIPTLLEQGKNIKASLLYLPMTIVYCGVDGYALISGYVGVNSKHKIQSIVNLWLQVMFYSVVITAIMCFFMNGKVTLGDVARSFLPILTNRYWYFTAYFGLFFLMPVLNKTLEALPKKEMKLSLYSLLFIFCIMSFIVPSDIWYFNKGQNVWWLMILYLIGGYIRKYDPFQNIKVKTLLVFLMGTVLLTWLSVIGIHYFSPKLNGWLYVNVLQNDSPFILAISILFLAVFSKIKIKKNYLKKYISYCASLTFGVYLIHVHPQVFSLIVQNGFRFLTAYSVEIIMLLTMAFSLAIMLLCMGVEALRKTILKRIENAICETISNNVYRIKERYLNDKSKNF